MFPRFSLTVVAVASLAWIGCGSESADAGTGSGATSTGTGATGAGAGGATASGVGGATATGTGATGAGGTATGAGGATSGSGTGGAAGDSGAGGATSGAGGASTGGSGGAMVSDAYSNNVEITVHDNVNTILVVTWTQVEEAEQTWLEFSFEPGNVMTSRPSGGQIGEHRDLVLGVPGETDVTVRVVSRVGGMDFKTSDYTGRTDAVPSVMPTPTVESYDADLASPNRWLFGAVEDSPSSVQQNRNNYYTGQFWLYIIDRQGRIVWYYNNPANNASSSFPRIARDGGYIWVDQGRSGDQGVIKMTLDREYFETIDAPIGDCIDVTDDGSLLYDVDGELFERTAGGQTRSIWDCKTELDLSPNCYSNTVNYNPALDSVVMSFPEPGAVVEIDRSSGDMIGYYGNQPGAWDFAPPLASPPDEWRFGIQHFPNITADGTLLVSTHLPPHDTFSSPPSPNEHAFVEFAVDRTNQVLTELWRYTEGPEWPHAKGMAIRLENGNTLANYGAGGVIREITPDKQTAFLVKWDLPDDGSDFYNKMVGHNLLIDDLYALNTGPL